MTFGCATRTGELRHTCAVKLLSSSSFSSRVARSLEAAPAQNPCPDPHDMLHKKCYRKVWHVISKYYLFLFQTNNYSPVLWSLFVNILKWIMEKKPESEPWSAPMIAGRGAVLLTETASLSHAPVPACSEPKSVATWGDGCSINATLFSSGGFMWGVWDTHTNPRVALQRHNACLAQWHADNNR